MFEPVLLILAGALIGAAGNRIRGHSISGGVWIAAAMFSAALYPLIGLWPALAFSGGWVAGEAFGWTKWINFIPRHVSQSKYNQHRFGLQDQTGEDWTDLFHAKPAHWVHDEAKDYRPFVLTGMICRGLLWWIAPLGALYYFGVAPWWALWLTWVWLATAFPFAYRLGYALDVAQWRYLQKSETIYGAVFGATIAALLIWFA